MPSAGARTAWPTAEEMSTALCVPGFAGERIGAAAEAVGQDAADRRDRRSRGEELRLRDELLFEDGEIAARGGASGSPSCRRRRGTGCRRVSSLRSAADAALARFVERGDAGDDGQLAGAVFDGVSWSRSDSTDLLNCSLAVCSSLFSRRSLESSWVWEREVKYWTEKNVERQSDEVTRETSEKSRRWDTFNFRNLARACGTKMIVE